MNRRWFLGLIGSVAGVAIAPKIGELVTISKPELITDDGVSVLLHQLGRGAPPQGSPGFAHGCLWQDIKWPDRVWFNAGDTVKAQWMEPPGDPEKFVAMVTRQRLNIALQDMRDGSPMRRRD